MEPLVVDSVRFDDMVTHVGCTSRNPRCPCPQNQDCTSPETCPAGLQAAIDNLYTDCGGLLLDSHPDGPGLDWDSAVGAVVKQTVEKCGCSGVRRQAASGLLLAAAAAVAASHFLG
jgi:hypothetical protein